MGIGGINEMKYEYWFANLQGISNRRKMEIRENVTNLEELFYIEETALKQSNLREKERENLIKNIDYNSFVFKIKRIEFIYTNLFLD